MKYLLTLSFIVLLFSCSNDEPTPKPQITDVEIGSGNSLTVARGTDLHVEAKVRAEGGIQEVALDIHGANWTFSKEFPELKGKKNGEIHTHIDVPSTAPAGNYHLHIKVLDLKGQETEAEFDLTVTE